MSLEYPYLGEGTRSPFTRSEIIRRISWGLVQGTIFRWSPRPWHGFRSRLLRAFGADIPEPSQVVVFPSATVTMPWKLSLAPRSMIGPRVTLYSLARITVGRGANISQNCHLCAGTHDFNCWSMPLVAKPIVIEANCWLAADVFVGPGVTIGELSVVGARSVVVRDLPAHHICVGNPCRAIKPRTAPTGP